MVASCWATCTRRGSSPTILRRRRLQIAGRDFVLGGADVTQALLTAQAHELVERSALGGRSHASTPAPAPDEALLAVHTAEYLDRLRAACAGGPWDGEYAPVSAATWDAARLTVGGVLAAVDAVLEGRVQRALVHARPAGHHAEPDRAIASTYLNNVACGAEHARARGVERVAIIDWDVHVANGAERIFWDRDDVLAISLHQQDWYPAHAGALRATGGPGAEGSTVNVPLPPATTDAGYLLAFDEIVAPILRAFRPELIMVAAGQDASVFDPTGRMMVSAAGFRTLAERVACLADELTGGRLVAGTEGGYSPIYNPFCFLAVLEGLAGESAGDRRPVARRRHRARRPGGARRSRPGCHRRRAERPAALVQLTSAAHVADRIADAPVAHDEALRGGVRSRAMTGDVGRRGVADRGGRRGGRAGERDGGEDGGGGRRRGAAAERDM